MRQVGMFAAACDFALDHNLDRLSQDHDNARLIADRLRECPGVSLAADPPQTNIVVFELTGNRLPAQQLVAALATQGILVNALGPTKLRLLTHLDVSREQCERAADALAKLLD